MEESWEAVATMESPAPLSTRSMLRDRLCRIMRWNAPPAIFSLERARSLTFGVTVDDVVNISHSLHSVNILPDAAYRTDGCSVEACSPVLPRYRQPPSVNRYPPRVPLHVHPVPCNVQPW